MRPDLELLAPALEVAVDVARNGEVADPPIDAPGSLRPLLRFARLPPPALRTVLVALDDDEFRARVVAATSESAVGRAGWLLLTRPDGWKDSLDELAGRRRRVASEREERRTDRVAHRLRAELARSEERSTAHLRELAELRRRFDEVQAAAASDREELGRARFALDEALSARARAVRELKDTERRLAERTAELRALRATRTMTATDAKGPAGVGSGAPTHGGHVADALRVDVAGHLAELRRGLDATTRGLAALESTVEHWMAGDVDDPARPASTGAPARRRRKAVPLGRGLTGETPEALGWLLEQPGAVVIVDGYNVSMLGWPELMAVDQRRALERSVGVLQRRTGARFVLVFDGADVTSSTGPSTDGGSGLSVRFTAHDIEADDDILELVTASTAPLVVVVSNDRRVRDGARERGANVVRSSDLLALSR